MKLLVWSTIVCRLACLFASLEPLIVSEIGLSVKSGETVQVLVPKNSEDVHEKTLARKLKYQTCRHSMSADTHSLGYGNSLTTHPLGSCSLWRIPDRHEVNQAVFRHAIASRPSMNIAAPWYLPYAMCIFQHPLWQKVCPTASPHKRETSIYRDGFWVGI